MRAWVIGLLGTSALLSGCGQSEPSDGQNIAENAQWIASVQPATPQAPAAEPHLSEIAGYDETVDRDPPADGNVALLCDPEKFRLSVRVADTASLDRSYPKRAVVSAESLIQRLPNHGGQMQYRGQLVRYAQCGPYSIRLTGNFYNANVEGELGAYPSFVTIRVSADNRMIVPNDGPEGLSIGECERDNRRAPDCPAHWAIRMDARYDSKRGKVVVAEHALSAQSFNDDPAIGRQRGARHYEVDRPLDMWEHVRDDRAAQASGTP